MYMYRWCVGLPLSAVGDGGGQQRTSDAVGLAGGGGVLRELHLLACILCIWRITSERTSVIVELGQ